MSLQPVDYKPVPPAGLFRWGSSNAHCNHPDNSNRNNIDNSMDNCKPSHYSSLYEYLSRDRWEGWADAEAWVLVDTAWEGKYYPVVLGVVSSWEYMCPQK